MDEELFEVGDVKIAKIGREYLAKIPIKEGEVFVTFTEISRSRQSLTTVISVQLNHSKEGQSTPFSQRIDLASASAVTDLRRSLDGAYGKEHNWTLVLNKAANSLRFALNNSEKPINFKGLKYEEDPFLMKPFLQKDACNMVFGDSEVGKSYFSLYMAVCLASGKPFMGYAIEAPYKKTLFLDYEDSPLIFNNRLFEVCGGLGISKDEISDYIQLYRPQGSIRDLVEVVSKFVAENKYDLIVIDAGSNAAGGSPNDEQKVVDMFNALEQIPCTKLIIHHEPKNTDGFADNKAFYGSTFWRALTRVAWRLVLENEEDGKLIKAVIAKKSNMGKVDPFLYRQKWEIQGFDYEGEDAPIHCTFTVEGEIHRNDDDEAIIKCLSENEEMSGNQMKEILGLTTDKFKKAIQRLKNSGVVSFKGNTRTTLWCLSARHQSHQSAPIAPMEF